MRHQPPGIHRITGEPATELIIHSTGGHAVAGVEHHADGCVVPVANALPQEKRGLAWTGEFGGTAEAAVPRVIFLFELGGGVGEDAGVQHQTALRFRLCVTGEAIVNFLRRIDDRIVLRLPEFLNPFQCLEESGSPETIVRGEIGSAEEGLQVRCEKNTHRPATRAGGRLDVGHVDFVHVRALFAIHLDADEMLVEEPGDFFVLERFAFHHVAPVAGRITDAEEDRFVLFARFGKGLVAPGIPIHRIMLVLEQVGRFLASKAVDMSVSGRRHGRFGCNLFFW